MISGDAVAIVVSRIVRQGSQRERILVEVLRLIDHRGNEVARPDVMSKVAEEPIAKWVVAQVLHDASAVGIGVGVLQLFGRRRWKAFDE